MRLTSKFDEKENYIPSGRYSTRYLNHMNDATRLSYLILP